MYRRAQYSVGVRPVSLPVKSWQENFLTTAQASHLFSRVCCSWRWLQWPWMYYENLCSTKHSQYGHESGSGGPTWDYLRRNQELSVLKHVYQHNKHTDRDAFFELLKITELIFRSREYILYDICHKCVVKQHITVLKPSFIIEILTHLLSTIGPFFKNKVTYGYRTVIRVLSTLR